MKNIIKKSVQGFAALALVFSFATVALQPATVGAIGVQDGVGSAKGDDQPADLTGNGGVFQTVTNVLLFIIGAVSVIMLIIGGIRYTTSGGNSSSVESAKNTILYAIVGLVVAILAYAVVQWVTTQFV